MILFPDSLAVTVKYLTTEFKNRDDPATITGRISDPRPDRLVVLTRTGTRRPNIAKQRTLITVECWETTQNRATNLATLTYGLMWDMDICEPGAVVHVVEEVGGIADYPDPETKNPRSQFTIVVESNALKEAP